MSPNLSTISIDSMNLQDTSLEKIKRSSINDNISNLLPSSVVTSAESDEITTSSEDDSNEGLTKLKENEIEVDAGTETESKCNYREKYKDKIVENSRIGVIDVKKVKNKYKVCNEHESPKKFSQWKGRPSSCIFVASLASSLTDDDLCISVTKTFEKFGELSMVKVLRDPENRPYAFVQYTNDAEANFALKKAQGILLNGRTIRCEKAKVNRTLFISNKNRFSSKGIPASKIIQLCERYGELEQVVASRNFPYKKNYYPVTKSNVWFIRFAYRDDAIRAYINLKPSLTYTVEWAQNIEVPKKLNVLNKKSYLNENNEFTEDEELTGEESDYDSEDDREFRYNKHSLIAIDKKSIFVGQLSPDVTKEKLHERFSNHGTITNINLIFKNNNTNIFAFITYDNERATATALERENHASFLNKTMHVQYKEIDGQKSRRTSNLKPFNGPFLNLAPPPISIGRRVSTGSFSTVPYHSMQYPSNTTNGNKYRNFTNYDKRRSVPNIWSGKFNKNEMEHNYQLNKVETDSELSGSVINDDISTSATTHENDSSADAGISGNHNTCKKKTGKRKFFGNINNDGHEMHNGFDPFYFSPHFYYAMDYSMPMPSPNSPLNQPYFYYYPLPPPPPAGPLNNSLPIMQHLSPVSHPNHYFTGDLHEEKVEKPELDY